MYHLNRQGKIEQGEAIEHIDQVGLFEQGIGAAAMFHLRSYKFVRL